MAGETLGEVLRRIGRTAGLQGVLALTDAQLLERFARRRDEPAFAALMVRHGPMVLGVCRRLLPDAGQAEDAFQAAFLVLARKAAAIQRRPLLSAWLYGVACKVAARLRGRLWRRQAREKPADLHAVPAAGESEFSDLAPVIHQEVQRLPDKYRDPVVLCYLEGRTHEEAARLLDWPLGTVKGRLARARDLLGSRLARRGLAPSEGAAAAALAVRPAAPPAAVIDATVRAAPLVAAGDPTGGGLASARAVMLSQGVIRTMMLTHWKIAAALGLTAVLLAGTGGYVYQTARGEPGGGPKAVPAAADKPGGGDKAKDDKDAILGTWQVTAVEMGGKDVSATDEFKDLATAKWTFTADKIAFHSGKPDMSATYKIDPSKKPKELDVTPLEGPSNEKDIRIPAIYSLEGDVLKICAASPVDRIRPTELASKEGAKTLLITFKRVEGGKDKPADKPKDDREAIQGIWRVTSVETGGKGVPNDEELRKLKASRFIFTAEKVTVQPGAERPQAASYRLDPSKTPKELDLMWEDLPKENGNAIPMIYSLDGDLLKLCLPSPPDRTRPTELASKGGSNVLVTLKRENAQKDKPRDDKEAIQDTWLLTGVETGGKDVSKTDNFRDMIAAKWTFGVDKVTLKLPGQKARLADYYIDPSKKPPELDVTPLDGPKEEKDIRISAIYGLEGDVLKVCIGSPQDATLPKELATKGGDSSLLLTFRRMPSGKDKVEDKSKDDKEALQGSWRVVALETDGKDQDDREARKVKAETWVFTADSLTLHIPGPAAGTDQDATCSYTADPTQSPKALDLTPGYGPDKGKTIRAVYSLDGDVLKICHGAGAGADRPKEVGTKEGSKTTMLTLKREAPDKGK